MEDKNLIELIVTANKAAKLLGYTVKQLNRLKRKYDLGRYCISIKNEKNNTGKVIWYERRSDKYGPYYALYTI